MRVINSLIMIGLPVFLALKVYRRGTGGFRPIWIGAGAFLISQIGHIPFNQFALMPVLEAWGLPAAPQEGWALLALGIVVGLSAGLFEEITRYLVFRFWLKKSPSELLPVKYGLGHGGIEAVLVGFLALSTFVQVLILGGDGALAAFEPEQAAMIQSEIELYWAVPWQQSLLGAWERVSALGFHLGASLLVYKSVRERKPIWLLIAILGHTALDAYAVVGLQKLDFVLLEGILFLFAAGWLVWAWHLRNRDEEGSGLDQAPLPDLNLPAPQITPEQLEESRYD